MRRVRVSNHATEGTRRRAQRKGNWKCLQNPNQLFYANVSLPLCLPKREDL